MDNPVFDPLGDPTRHAIPSWRVMPRLLRVTSLLFRAADISDCPFGWGWFAGEIKRAAEEV